MFLEAWRGNFLACPSLKHLTSGDPDHPVSDTINKMSCSGARGFCRESSSREIVQWQFQLHSISSHCLKTHRESHGIKIECDVCKQMFSATYIAEHRRRKHFGKKITCKYCKKTLFDEQSFKGHMKVIHKK